MAAPTGVRAGAVPETPFWLEVNGRRVAAWSCVPEHLDALAMGWLLAEGYLDPGEAPSSVEVVAGATAGVRVRLAPERVARADAEREHRREHGCGIAHLTRCATGGLRRDGVPRAIPPAADFAALFRELYTASDRYRETGGVHTAALTDGRSLMHRTEEVGRHNAVDKAIGRTLLAGVDPAGLGLVLTARISGEIALKAARARLGWIASRSVPTTLALEIAGAAGVPILARAAGKDPRLHAPDGAAEGEAAAADGAPP